MGVACVVTGEPFYVRLTVLKPKVVTVRSKNYLKIVE